MRALVTGASGFLGRRLCAALVEKKHFVVGLVRDLLAQPFPSAAALVFGNFTDVERAIAEYEIDTVFHLAAQTQVSVGVTHPVATLEANVQGTWMVLEACRRQKVKRVIVASSDKAYGEGGVPYREDQGLRPHGIYATSKACADMIAQSYAIEYGMSVAITRCGNLYGPGHTNFSTLIPSTIKSALRNEAPQLRSDGFAKRDFVYVDDAVDGYIKLADYGRSAIVNFGTGRGLTVRQVAQHILDLMGVNVEVLVSELRAQEIDWQILDASFARDVLGWKPRTFEEGIVPTIAWYRDAFEKGTIR